MEASFGERERLMTIIVFQLCKRFQKLEFMGIIRENLVCFKNNSKLVKEFFDFSQLDLLERRLHDLGIGTQQFP